MPKSKSPMKINNEDCLLTFMDILGYREQLKDDVESLKKAKSVLEQLYRFGATGQMAKDYGERSIDEATATIALSDAVVRIRPLKTQAPLFYELIDLVHGLMNLVNNGHFVRGAISRGLVYAEPSKNLVISKALLDAYVLESEVSIYPRVIVDPTLAAAISKDDKLKSTHHSWKQEMQYIDRLIRKDLDGLYFVDYLKAAYRELDDPNEEYPEFIKKHRDYVKAGLAKFPGKPKVLVKYQWLAEYHNSVVATFEPVISKLTV